MFIVLSCQKDDTTYNHTVMPPCTISNKGIFLSSERNSNMANNSYIVDSVVLKLNKYSIWFTENGTNEKFIATLKRYDNSKFLSGKYHSIDSASIDFKPPYNSIQYPVVFFEVKSLNNSQNYLYIYDKYDVCIDVENAKFGILIDGIKVADSRPGNSSRFLTFSIDKSQVINR
jgi:hypothetical protein